MKNLIVLIISSLVCLHMTFGQTEGTITYNETVKLDIDLKDMGDLGESIKAMIPTSRDLSKELHFNQSESVYQNCKGESVEDTNVESEDGSIQIKIMQDDTEDILYQNINDKKTIHQRGMFGKSFIVESTIAKSKWKITNEKVKYLGYECQKATLEDDDQFIIAWFTTQIPTQTGPSGITGLPGAILMVSIDEGKTEIKATKVDLKKLDADFIKIPSEGKKVTEEEYEIIQKEKEEEMTKMFGGTRSFSR